MNDPYTGPAPLGIEFDVAFMLFGHRSRPREGGLGLVE